MNLIENFDLQERLFIVQSFYQNKCQISNVKNDFEATYGNKECQEDAICEIIRLFEETGTVSEKSRQCKCLEVKECHLSNLTNAVKSEPSNVNVEPIEIKQEIVIIENKAINNVFDCDENDNNDDDDDEDEEDDKDDTDEDIEENEDEYSDNDDRSTEIDTDDVSSDPLDEANKLSKRKKGRTKTNKKKSISITCKKCLKIFRNAKSYRSHIKTHQNETCTTCNKKVINLKEHMRTVHKDKEKTLCPICGKYYFCLMTHMGLHTDTRPYKCEYCSKSFNHKFSWQRHTLIHTRVSKDYICEICSRSFFLREQLTTHQKQHNRSKYYNITCEICGNKFRHQSDLRLHMRVHTKERPFECNICQKRFSQKYILNAHLLRHDGATPLKCDICQKNFYYKYLLKKHLKKHCEPNKAPVIVRVDAKEFFAKHNIFPEKPKKQSDVNTLQKSNLLPALQDINDPNKLVDASTAGLLASEFMSKLPKRERKREPRKPKEYLVKCDICNKSFRNNYALKEHRTVHTGEKRYKCHICEKAFRQQSGLINHALIHTADRKFKCQLCDKAFNQRESLKIHYRVHTGEKTETCKICGKALASKITLRKHMESFHSNEPLNADSINNYSTDNNSMSIDSNLQ